MFNSPNLITENDIVSWTIYLLYTNNNYFDLLLIIRDKEKIDFKKFNRSEYTKRIHSFKEEQRKIEIFNELLYLFSLKIFKRLYENLKEGM